MHNTRYSLAIFDLDGTILNTPDDLAASVIMHFLKMVLQCVQLMKCVNLWETESAT